MSKKIPVMYLCTALVTLVPIAGRLYYGIPVIILINFLMLTTTLFDYGLCILKIDSLKKTYLMMFLVGMVLFFRQILIFYSPMVALGLGFMLYIPIAEVLLLGDFFTEHKEKLANTLKQNMRTSLIFSLYVFMFFLLREVIGYGTVSLPKVLNYVEGHPEYKPALERYSRIMPSAPKDLTELQTDEINSSGYVVDTLEAALWSFLTTDSYKECLLKAVNLAGDADSIGAVVGGMAGLYYCGDEERKIPQEWMEKVRGKKLINSLLDKFCATFGSEETV